MNTDDVFILPTINSVRISNDNKAYYISYDGVAWIYISPEIRAAQLVKEAEEAIREMELLLAQDEPSPFELKEVQTA